MDMNAQYIILFQFIFYVVFINIFFDLCTHTVCFNFLVLLFSLLLLWGRMVLLLFSTQIKNNTKKNQIQVRN